MRYVEKLPPFSLATAVRCFWFLDATSPEKAPVQPVFPDGSSELVIHLGEPFSRLYDAGGEERQSVCFLVGQMERALLLRPTRRARVVGVRFYPWGVKRFTRVPQNQIAGRTVEARDLWGSETAVLVEQLSGAAGVDAQVALLSSFLERRLQPPPANRDVELAVRQIAAQQRRGGLQYRWSDRHLRRRFLDEVGLTPKSLERILRFQRAIGALHEASWAAVAVSSGYYDQAHFIRDFREFTGQTPSRFVTQDSPLARIFLSDFSKTEAAPRA